VKSGEGAAEAAKYSQRCSWEIYF